MMDVESQIKIIDLSERGKSICKISKELNISQYSIYTLQKSQKMTYI